MVGSIRFFMLPGGAVPQVVYDLDRGGGVERERAVVTVARRNGCHVIVGRELGVYPGGVDVNYFDHARHA